jgi:hypothetical protein
MSNNSAQFSPCSLLPALLLTKALNPRKRIGRTHPSSPEREPIKSKAKQDGRRAEGGGRVVVVGQSAVSWKVIGAGILVVLLAVLRNRSRKSKSSK